MEEFIELLVDAFKASVKEVVTEEMENPNYLSSSEFPNIRERANAGMQDMTEQARLILALKIAEHRRDQHGEKLDEEVEFLRSQIDPEYLERADSLADFWLIW